MNTNSSLRYGLLFILLSASQGHASTNIWTGNGDSNNSGLWSSTANWDTGVPGASDTAILPEVTGNGNDGVAARTVTNDAGATVRELIMVQTNSSYPNQIVLDADLSVGRIYVTPDTDTGINACRINVNGRNLTIGLFDLKSRVGGGRGIPYCSGSGTISSRSGPTKSASRTIRPSRSPAPTALTTDTL